MSPSLYWIDASWPGRLAITSRPRGGDWLENEVEGWKKNKVDVVASLLAPDEVEELGLKAESAVCDAHHIEFLSFPIRDRDIPHSRSKVTAFLGTLREALDGGRNVAIHCRQSVGRAGLISAALLIGNGASVDDALQQISRTRGVSVPETAEQRQWLTEFAKNLSPSGKLAVPSSS